MKSTPAVSVLSGFLFLSEGRGMIFRPWSEATACRLRQDELKAGIGECQIRQKTAYSQRLRRKYGGNPLEYQFKKRERDVK
jgi:hypothetical protein